MLTSVVLLAGNSSRMGEPKQHVKIFGRSFIEHVTDNLVLMKRYFSRMIFVGRDNDAISKNLIKNIGGIWKVNPNPEYGPLSSIKIAIQDLEEPTPILLWPIDHPLISAETVEALIKLWMINKTLITVPSDGMRRGHPTIFPEWAYHEFFNADMNKGAKQILENNMSKIQYLITQDNWIRANLNDKIALGCALQSYAS